VTVVEVQPMPEVGICRTAVHDVASLLLVAANGIGVGIDTDRPQTTLVSKLIVGTATDAPHTNHHSVRITRVDLGLLGKPASALT
jgi:hypothetical protein